MEVAWDHRPRGAAKAAEPWSCVARLRRPCVRVVRRDTWADAIVHRPVAALRNTEAGRSLEPVAAEVGTALAPAFRTARTSFGTPPAGGPSRRRRGGAAAGGPLDPRSGGSDRRDRPSRRLAAALGPATRAGRRGVAARLEVHRARGGRRRDGHGRGLRAAGARGVLVTPQKFNCYVPVRHFVRSVAHSSLCNALRPLQSQFD